MWDNPAVLNPFRWKSQYYDSDTELYYIDNRWYDPKRERFISSASPECLLSNAATVFALNLYAFALTNPVAIMLACGSIYPSLDFYFDGTLSWWERYWRWVVLGIGVAATIIAVALAPFTCGASAGAGAAIATTLFNIAMGTVIGAATTLAIGGITAGISSALKGNGFWNGFAEYYASVNLADVLLTSFAFAAVGVAISNAVGAFQCFKEGTLVATEDGLKPIENIEVGDKVLAYDEATGEKAYKPVVQLFKNETKRWCTVTVEVDGQEEQIVSTPGHKYYLPNNNEDREIGKKQEHESYYGLSEKWISACHLKNGDKVLLSDNKYGIVKSVKIHVLKTPETTYNFEVADFHTYYVGEDSVCVHNAGCGGDFKKYSAEEIAKRGDITSEQFHREVKPKILKEAPKNLGKNPDILLNRDNIVGLSSRINKNSYNTGKSLFDFITRR